MQFPVIVHDLCSTAAEIFEDSLYQSPVRRFAPGNEHVSANVDVPAGLSVGSARRRVTVSIEVSISVAIGAAPELPVNVGDRAGAPAEIPEGSVNPPAMHILASGIKGVPAHTDVLAGLGVVTGRRWASLLAMKVRINIGDISGAPLEGMQGSVVPTTRVGLACGVERIAVQCDILAGIVVRTGRNPSLSSAGRDRLPSNHQQRDDSERK